MIYAFTFISGMILGIGLWEGIWDALWRFRMDKRTRL